MVERPAVALSRRSRIRACCALRSKSSVAAGPEGLLCVAPCSNLRLRKSRACHRAFPCSGCRRADKRDQVRAARRLRHPTDSRSAGTPAISANAARLRVTTAPAAMNEYSPSVCPAYDSGIGTDGRAAAHECLAKFVLAFDLGTRAVDVAEHAGRTTEDASSISTPE